MNITIGQASSITVFCGKEKIVVRKVNDITFSVFTPQKRYIRKKRDTPKGDKARRNRSVRFNTNYNHTIDKELYPRRPIKKDLNYNQTIDKELYPHRPIKKDLNNEQLDRELEEYHKECKDCLI